MVERGMGRAHILATIVVKVPAGYRSSFAVSSMLGSLTRKSSVVCNSSSVIYDLGCCRVSRMKNGDSWKPDLVYINAIAAFHFTYKKDGWYVCMLEDGLMVGP